ncbi:protein SENESCENCE-ASSOCIATED GENE 21, mitochondrial-like [Momordica charantia]|uniref:Protein SENESCENCE-ASSOCIATED GENE 21, mitochondrial-like n=1 Tax=Momordica charantia TaxID=3673 RepID=A0A6J1DPX0_MOMCH|nr:protein SENESCENCE-ASSOCIATED GENE 21, mitochondrial-like [Momordica charantia]
MAPSFSILKNMSALLSNALFRREYSAAAAASQGVASSAAAGRFPARGGGVMKKEEAVRSSREKVAWVPDPVTGFYRPENCSDEIDAADLRALLLKPRRNIIN